MAQAQRHRVTVPPLLAAKDPSPILHLLQANQRTVARYQASKPNQHPLVFAILYTVLRLFFSGRLSPASELIAGRQQATKLSASHIDVVTETVFFMHSLCMGEM
jgi:hypothetical protein